MFYNKSNDYVCPVFPTCENVQDKYYFEFLNNKSVGIISNTKTEMSMSLSDVSIPVESYNQNTLFLGAGQYHYITGGDKGCQQAEYIYNIKDINIDEVYDEVQLYFNVYYFKKFERKYRSYTFTLIENNIKDNLININDTFKKDNILINVSIKDDKLNFEYLHP
ncbi:MAG: hypothetical protein RSF67_09930, partial [Clostridia bacterium]